MIPSTQITNTEIFAFIVVLVFKLLSLKVIFINRKDNLSGCNWTRTHNHLVHKQTLNHLAKLAK